MSSVSLSAVALGILLCIAPVAADELRVCADPNNLPFSNQQREGFENKIVELVARDLGMDLTYVWWAQRRGYVGEALNMGLCDLIPGIGRVDGVLLTYPPYYRSAYAFVTRPGEPVVSSLDDPRLRQLRVGVQLVGDSDASTPPAAALARRGVTENVRGYTIVGDYGLPNPPAAIINAVARGELDVAFAWGPLAGYFGAEMHPPLVTTPITAYADTPDLPMQFDISMGLRPDEGPLRMRIERALATHKAEIDAILAAYHVPRIDVEARL